MWRKSTPVVGLAVLFSAAMLPAQDHETLDREQQVRRIEARQAADGLRLVPELSAPCPIKANLVCPASTTGVISSSSCLDLVIPSDSGYFDRYSFSASVGQTVTVTMSSSAFSVFLVLEQPGDHASVAYGTITSSLSSGVSRETLTYVIPSAGVYTIAADTLYGVADSQAHAGAYTLTVTGCTGSASGCTPDATTLCIDDQFGDRRFRIRVAFATVQGTGSAGNGRAIALSSLGVAHGGLFWFFSADNPELLIKVLPACGVNGNHWVFASAGTNVGLTITVTDLNTGMQKVYTNADLHAMNPIQDVSAFPCP